MSAPIVLGLYTYTQKGFSSIPFMAMRDAMRWLERNRWVLDEYDVYIYAGDPYSKNFLEKIGLKPRYPEINPPRIIIENRAHYMKHWIVYCMLREHGEVLWLDWDTLVQKPLDKAFWNYARLYELPKFVRIQNYRYGVNAGVYYVGGKIGLNLFIDSFKYMYTTWPPNDELLWIKVLEEKRIDYTKIWWSDLVIDIHTHDYKYKKNKAYIIHNL